ncbi:hypothetical protein DFH06DRAFT_1178748 [Mycena polygramma]|nr:hypothetical protein DFH06DRAFT_1178748 [Mycena polygramma]
MADVSYQVLCDNWRKFEPTTPEDMQPFVAWLWCTRGIVAEIWHFRDNKPDKWSPTYLAITSDFRTTFCVPLRDTLLQAATRAREASTRNDQPDPPGISGRRKEVLQSITKLLGEMAHRIAKPEDSDYAGRLDWDSKVDAEINEITMSLRTMAAAVE